MVKFVPACSPLETTKVFPMYTSGTDSFVMHALSNGKDEYVYAVTSA